MPGQSETPSAAPAFALDPRVVKAFARMASGFWSGPTRQRARLLTMGLVLSLTLSLCATLALNRWHRWFFDALEGKDAETAALAVVALVGIVAAMAAIGVCIVLTRETLQVRWRAWVTQHLVARWLDRQRFYHLEHTPDSPANPEYRISDDTRWATEILVDFAIGLFSAVVGAIAFISILWSVGGALNLSIAGASVTIPAYMVLLAVGYGALASTLMLVVGRPLVGAVVRKNEAEGYFRFAMMRVRDNAESIALLQGGPGERRAVGRLYDEVIGRWLAIVRQHGRLTWITNASGPLIPIVPLLFATPKYLAGELSLGQVIQIAAAFVQVQMAISWLVDNFSRIADWYASARRIMELAAASELVGAERPARGIEIATSPDGRIHVSGLTLHDNAGRTLGAGLDLIVRPGEKLLVSGESGTGKSGFVRALVGLTPRGRGIIRLPKACRLMVVPQKPYVPVGTLREALLYPCEPDTRPDAVLRSALEACGLGDLAHRLDDDERWDRRLSTGELQLMAFARVLAHRPDVAIFDEHMTALDQARQQRLLAVLAAELPETTVIVLTQRHAPAGWHDRHIKLDRREATTSSGALEPVPA